MFDSWFGYLWVIINSSSNWLRNLRFFNILEKYTCSWFVSYKKRTRVHKKVFFYEKSSSFKLFEGLILFMGKMMRIVYRNNATEYRVSSYAINLRRTESGGVWYVSGYLSTIVFSRGGRCTWWFYSCACIHNSLQDSTSTIHGMEYH